MIERAIGGSPVSTVFEGQRRFDIAARYAPEARAHIDGPGGTLVRTPDGGRVPLSQLADIRVIQRASIIARRENQRQFRGVLPVIHAMVREGLLALIDAEVLGG